MNESLESMIFQRLKELMPLQSFQFEDQSYQHAGHNDAAKAGGTHIKLEIVSAAFDGLNRVERHRLIYENIDSIVKERKIHAIALSLRSPSELVK